MVDLPNTYSTLSLTNMAAWATENGWGWNHAFLAFGMAYFQGMWLVFGGVFLIQKTQPAQPLSRWFIFSGWGLDQRNRAPQKKPDNFRSGWTVFKNISIYIYIAIYIYTYTYLESQVPYF